MLPCKLHKTAATLECVICSDLNLCFKVMVTWTWFQKKESLTLLRLKLCFLSPPFAKSDDNVLSASLLLCEFLYRVWNNKWLWLQLDLPVGKRKDTVCFIFALNSGSLSELYYMLEIIGFLVFTRISVGSCTNVKTVVQRTASERFLEIVLPFGGHGQPFVAKRT